MNLEKVNKLASDFKVLLEQQKFIEAIDKFYSVDVIQIEPDSSFQNSVETKGLESVRSKNEQWLNMQSMNEFKVSGPYIFQNRFILALFYDFTSLQSHERTRMSVLNQYTVVEDKIKRVAFHFGPAL